MTWILSLALVAVLWLVVAGIAALVVGRGLRSAQLSEPSVAAGRGRDRPDAGRRRLAG